MKIKSLIILRCLLFLFEPVEAQVQVSELRVEFLKNPLGIDVKSPQLSWQLKSKERNILQVAYEIRMNKDMPALLNNSQLVWQTGKVTSNQSLHIIYAGDQLQPGQKYYWQ